MLIAIKSDPWTPWVIPRSLLAAFWDVEIEGSLTRNGAAATGWKDVIGGLALTGTGTYGATSFNGRPGMTFNGTSDCFAAAGVGGMPTGTVVGETWALVDQVALVADTGNRTIIGCGGSGAGKQRILSRVVSTGVNRFRATSGSGSATLFNTQVVTELSGRHLVRAVFRATDVLAETDGLAPQVVTDITLNTDNTDRVRIGAVANTAASLFWSGTMSAILAFRGAVPTVYADPLRAWLNARLT